MKELDKKDWRLLDLLQDGSRNAVGKIAKELALHKNSVTYRIKRLERLGFIRHFSFIPSYLALQKDTFYVLFRLKFSEAEQESIYTYLKTHPLALSVYRLSGEWNFMVELICDDINHFNDELAKMTDKLGNAVSDYQTIFLYRPYKVESSICFTDSRKTLPFVLVGPLPPRDPLDKKILGVLCDDSNRSHNEIARMTKASPDTSFYRIKKLIEQKVIKKFVPMIDLGKLGYQHYLIQLKLSDINTEQFESLRRYLVENKNIYYVFRTAGELGVLIFCAFPSNSELDSSLTQLDRLFGSVIRKQEILIVSDVLVINRFPTGLRT